jgi:hypothetical protein
MANEEEKGHYDQIEVITAIKDLESTILDALNSKDPLWWRIVQIILPVGLATILGFIVWMFQSDIDKTIKDKASLLQAQLGLTQYLYEQRFASYQNLYDKVLAVYRSMQELQTHDQQAQISTNTLDSNTRLLGELITANKLVASHDLITVLTQVWYDTSKGETAITTEEVMKKIEDQMRKDLFVDKLPFDDIFSKPGTQQ